LEVPEKNHQICGSRQFFRNAGSLALAMVAVSVLVGPLAYMAEGGAGVMRALAAAVLCLVCGVIAIGLRAWFSSQNNPLAGLLGSMAVRFFPPLVLCLLIAIKRPDSEVFVFVGSLLMYYLVTLSVESWLAVQDSQKKPVVSGDLLIDG
jgi:hypothetical protein